MKLTDHVVERPFAIGNASRERPIGAILIDAGRISPETAERILRHQKEHAIRFGDAGLAMGLINQEDIRFALAHQFDYTYVAPGDNPTTAEVVAAFQPNHRCVEAMRALRSQLMVRWLDTRSEQKSLAIVSTESGVGKTFIAANLAVVFSQLGEKTLLVDANLRTPRMHELFKFENRLGLSSVLANDLLEDPIVELSAFVGLSVFPAGPLPPNPQELLSRPAFRTLVERMSDRYDVVIMDTPSWGVGADSQIIGSRSKAALLVARLDYTSVNGATNFVETLGQSGCQVLGAVMNQF